MARKKSPPHSRANAPIRLVASVSAMTSPEHSAIGEHEIASRAYHKWLARGCPLSDGSGDWFEAQRELHEERSDSAH